MNLSTVKWAEWDKTQSRHLLGLFICVCIALCTIVAHHVAQNRPDNFPCYPPDNHHCSDDVYEGRGGWPLTRPTPTPSRLRILANVNSSRSVRYMLSPVCLYLGGWNFWQCFYAVWSLDRPLTSTENFTEMALLLCYFVEFGSFRGAMRKSFRSLSHVVSSCWICYCSRTE